MKLSYYFIFYIWFSIVQIEIDIEPTDKVERIKERVEEKEGIPPQQQRLIFSGKQMWVLVFNALVYALVWVPYKGFNLNYVSYLKYTQNRYQQHAVVNIFIKDREFLDY